MNRQDQFRYQPYPSQMRREKEGGPESCGISSISGIDASLGDIPQKPIIPESDSPLPLLPNPLEDGPDMEKVASATFEDVIRQEKQLLKFTDELDYVGMNIGIALSYIQDILPRSSRIFYIGFSGAKGAGKSTATSICSKLLKDGIKLEGVTYPALADACREGKHLCLDEFDAQSERCPELETIVRQGIHLDSHYVKLITDGKGGWIRDEIPIGGMKVLNWRNPIDDALLQRILVIKMASGASTRTIVNNEAPERFTSPIRIWFDARSCEVHRKWSPDRIHSLIQDKDDHLTNKLDRLVSAVDRHKQKAFWMLVVCEVFGWDFDSTIKHLIEKQPEDEAYEDYKPLVAELYYQRKEQMEARGFSGPLEVDLVDFKNDMTGRIDQKGLFRLKPKGNLSWTGLRQECGFVDGVNERKSSRKSGKKVITFDERVLNALGIESTRQATITSEVPKP